MLPNWSVLWVIFFVLVLTYALDKLLLGPVIATIRRREEAIVSARELAKRSAAEAQAAASEFEQKTTAARAEIYRQMDDMRRDALGRRTELLARTRAEAEAEIAAAAARLDADARETRDRLRAEADALGAAAADRILGRRVS